MNARRIASLALGLAVCTGGYEAFGQSQVQVQAPPDASILEQPIIPYKAPFTAINTGPTNVTIGTTTATLTELVGFDDKYDQVSINSVGAGCNGAKLGTLATDNSCTFNVFFQPLDKDPFDVFNKTDDFGKWFLQVSVPYTGGTGSPGVAGVNIFVLDCGAGGTSGPTCSPVPEPATLGLVSSPITFVGISWLARAFLRQTRGRQ